MKYNANIETFTAVMFQVEVL